jgi:arylsulfatase A-like enzyme
MTPAERAGVVNEYDRELVHLDHWLGVLLEHLDRHGYASKTLVAVTSDHGESLGEHQQIGHGKDLFAEMLDVPLIVWEPGTAPGRVARPVQIPDLFPTILRFLGLPVPEGTQGQLLLEADHAIVAEQYNTPEQGRRAAAEPARPFQRVLRTIRLGGLRFFQGSSGEERLFDGAADPHETQDLIAVRPEDAAAARARLEAWLRATPEAPVPAERPRKADPEALENLRALGYIQ